MLCIMHSQMWRITGDIFTCTPSHHLAICQPVRVHVACGCARRALWYYLWCCRVLRGEDNTLSLEYHGHHLQEHLGEHREYSTQIILTPTQTGIICLYCSAIMLQFLGSSQWEQWLILNLIQNLQHT